MESKIITAMPLEVFYDTIFKVSYISFLTKNSFIKVKLACNFKDYKYQHLLSVEYQLTCRIVKTKKNWVLTEIEKYQKIYNPKTFNDYLKLSQICQIVLSKIKENQDLEVYTFLSEYLTNVEKTIDLKDFEYLLSKNLGF
jgi:hypothetical protein